MIADLHCHYPMHLLADDDHLHGKWADWFTRVRDDVDAELVDLAARAANDPSWSGGWRVNVPGLVKGHARIVCSVLYWPSDEFQHGSTPAPGSFADLQSLLHFVEDDLTKRGQLVVKCATDLDRAGRMAFVHCVEGGFHLGPDENEIDANVQWLAKQGVLYITLAHLFFKGVATNAPSIPPLSDAVYDAVHQPPGRGLTNLGRAAGPRRSRSPRLPTKSGPSRRPKFVFGGCGVGFGSGRKRRVRVKFFDTDKALAALTDNTVITMARAGRASPRQAPCG